MLEPNSGRPICVLRTAPSRRDSGAHQAVAETPIKLHVHQLWAIGPHDHFEARSSAMLSLSTLTRGSPSTPSVRPSVFSATRPRTCSAASPRAFETRESWYSAAATLICGSRPLPEAVTRSTGTSAVLPGSASRSALIRSLTASANAGLRGPWFEPEDDIPL